MITLVGQSNPQDGKKKKERSGLVCPSAPAIPCVPQWWRAGLDGEDCVSVCVCVCVCKVGDLRC